MLRLVLSSLSVLALVACSDKAPGSKESDSHHASGQDASVGNGGDGDGDTSGHGDGDAPSHGDGDTSTPGDGDTSNPGDGDQSSADAGSDSDGGLKPPPHEGFLHPGIMVDKIMLDFVKNKIAENAEPWKSALDEAKNSKWGSLDYQAGPRATVECGPYSNPDIGCGEEKSDVIAAYTHALLWYHTGNQDNANKAIEIMNAWSSTIKEHTNSNAPLQTAWAAEVFPRAAEIIRHTGAGWSDDDVKAFEDMLRNVYLPLIINGSSSNGNWELSMIEAVINIGIFLDDKDVFDKGVKMWRERVPAYVYLSSDGPTPVPPPRGNKSGDALIGFWYNQSTFMDGLCQETCRDLGHVQYGLAAMINAGQTAAIQGVDLLGEQQERIRATLGFHAKFINGASVPGNLCGGSLNAVSADPMWEIAYNYYGNARGYDLPQTKQLAESIRPSGADHHMVWETLTHANIGAAGLP